MKITGMEYIHASPYMTRAHIADELGVSTSTIDGRVRELKEEKERYGEFAIIKDGGLVLINYLAFLDFLKYRDRLKEKTLRKNVPNFKPEEMARSIGWYQ